MFLIIKIGQILLWMIATSTTSQNYEKQNRFLIIIDVIIKEHNYSDQIKTNWKNKLRFST